MCGIIGYVGKNNALDVIINGLERLEYRGYDSAGIAFIDNNELKIIKETGRIENLKKSINLEIKSDLGIGHTRWATHGIPNNINSHPHKVGKIIIVHNGIIENYQQLKKDLSSEYKFISETDTEVACALLDKIYSQTNNMEQTISIFKEKAKGAYALGIICIDNLDTLYAVKKESPLIIGIGQNENYIASDVPAILKYTNNYILLEDNDFAKITSNKIFVYNDKSELVKKEIHTFNGTSNNVERGNYEHYMIKEINEEPEVIKNTITSYINKNSIIDLPDLEQYNKIDIVACGSAMYAGYVGKYLIEKYAHIPVNIEAASEYRYKELFLNDKTLVIVISQSGETADTLAALKIATSHKVDTLGIINVVESTIARNANKVIYTKAGTEIAVATTKAYISQLAILSLMALKNVQNNRQLILDYKKLPTFMEYLLNKCYKEIASKIYTNESIFFIGRNIDYALSLEGALKLKETAYINANAYAAGELKHGPISLIEEGTPVIAIITNNDIAEKTISNIKEVKTRGAYVIVVAIEGIELDNIYDQLITIPNLNEFVNPILTIIPLQLLAYEVAKLRGCDIDKPKNLAKSVTVE